MKITILIASLAFVCSFANAQIDTVKSYWDYSNKVNEMTNVNSYFAETSDNAGNISGTITIRHKKKENDVILTVFNGILNYQTSYGVTGIKMSIKFDNSKISTYWWLQPTDGSFDTTFLNSANSFIKKVKNAKVTYISIEIYNQGTHVFKFNTANLKWDY